MAMVTIDGVDLPSPSTYKTPQFDLDSADSDRNELGVLQRDRKRQGIYRLELSWKSITSSELHLIESAIEKAKLNVTFIASVGKIKKQMYAGDRNSEMIKYSDDPNQILWSLSFNLIEY